MKQRVLSKTTPFHPFKKKKKKGKRAERCRFERHCSSFFFPPEHAAGKKGKMLLFLKFLPAPLSRLEPTDRTQWPTTYRAPPTEPRQPRPMADSRLLPVRAVKNSALGLYK